MATVRVKERSLEGKQLVGRARDKESWLTLKENGRKLVSSASLDEEWEECMLVRG